MKKKHRIFKAIVIVDNQSDCNVAREICERYELPMWKNKDLAFEYIHYDDADVYLQYQTEEDVTDEYHIGFFVETIDDIEGKDLDIVTIDKFEELANDYNPQHKSLEEIVSKFNEVLSLITK